MRIRRVYLVPCFSICIESSFLQMNVKRMDFQYSSNSGSPECEQFGHLLAICGCRVALCPIPCMTTFYNDIIFIHNRLTTQVQNNMSRLVEVLTKHLASIPEESLRTQPDHPPIIILHQQTSIATKLRSLLVEAKFEVAPLDSSGEQQASWFLKCSQAQVCCEVVHVHACLYVCSPHWKVDLRIANNVHSWR